MQMYPPSHPRSCAETNFVQELRETMKHLCPEQKLNREEIDEMVLLLAQSQGTMLSRSDRVLV